METVKLPEYSAGSDADLKQDILTWLSSDALRYVTDEFGGPRVTDLVPEQVDALADFTDQWDFRRGQERNLAEVQDYAESHAGMILAAARALGLVDSSKPAHASYDHAIVLGGLIRACILRPRLAAELVRGGLVARTITGIGAFRPLGGDEPGLASAAGLSSVSNEFEAMDAGMKLAFGLSEEYSERGEDHPENANLSWRVREYATTEGVVSVVAAPTTDPQRRANTPDSYSYWANQLVEVGEGERVLLITSAIYVPFQHADAVRMLGLPYGAIVDTVGVDTSLAREAALRQSFQPSQYLQEIRSAILSMRNLLIALES